VETRASREYPGKTEIMKHRPGIVWKKLLWPLVFVALLPVGVFLLGVYIVVRARDFRHIPKGVYPAGFEGDFAVWSRRLAARHGQYDEAVRWHDFHRMSPEQQAQRYVAWGWAGIRPIPNPFAHVHSPERPKY
jgi:hypothetical protein